MLVKQGSDLDCKPYTYDRVAQITHVASFPEPIKVTEGGTRPWHVDDIVVWLYLSIYPYIK